MLLFWLEAEVSANAEPSKQPKRPTDLDNPSDLIKEAQKELVINNMSNEEKSKKAKDMQGLLQELKHFIVIFGNRVTIRKINRTHCNTLTEVHKF